MHYSQVNLHLCKLADIKADIDTLIVAGNGMNIISAVLISVHLVIFNICSNSLSSWCWFALVGACCVWGESTPWLIGIPAVEAIALLEFLHDNASHTACTIAGISSLVSNSIWCSEPTSLVPRPDLLLCLFLLFAGGALTVTSSRVTDCILLWEPIALKRCTWLSAQYNKMH